jgi:hypothetical protein
MRAVFEVLVEPQLSTAPSAIDFSPSTDRRVKVYF